MTGLRGVVKESSKDRSTNCDRSGSDSSDHAPTCCHESPSFCSSHHKEELQLYCHDCNAVICSECAVSGEHHLHDFDQLKEVAANIKECLPKMVKTMKGRQIELNGTLQLKVNALSPLGLSGETAINEACDVIVQRVENYRKSLLQDWKSLTSKELNKTRVPDHDLEQKLARLSRAVNFIEGVETSQQPDSQLTTMLKPMMRDFKDLCSISKPRPNKDKYTFHYVVTSGGDPHQLEAVLPKILPLSHTSVSVHVPEPHIRRRGEYSDNITITVVSNYWHDLSTIIPDEAVIVNLTSYSTKISIYSTLTSVGKNKWIVNFEPLEGVHVYQVKVTVLGLQCDAKTFQYPLKDKPSLMGVDIANTLHVNF